MTGENFAGNIISNLASLPDFLRKPILAKRMKEFFALPESEKQEIIENALNAGPTVDFGRFEKLFKTWLEILATLQSEQRAELISAYVTKVVKDPEKLIKFNTDAIFGIFLTLQPEQHKLIAASLRDAVSRLDERESKIIKLIVPDVAQQYLRI